MRPGQEGTGRLAPQDIGRGPRGHAEGRVRLPALELADRKRPLKACDMFAHPAAERRFVEPERSEGRPVGKECVSTFRSRWAPDPYKKNKTTQVQQKHVIEQQSRQK